MRQDYLDALEFILPLAQAYQAQEKKINSAQQQIKEITAEVRGLQIEVQRILHLLREKGDN